MEHTKLIYMEEMQKLTDIAQVVGVFNDGDIVTLELDQTIFYPQGGGQPYDIGFIESTSGKFKVNEVRFVDGIVKHVGEFETGSFNIGDEVNLLIDAERRKLHARLHSAGHVVDMAVHNLGLKWMPGKGYHFPDGPYIEYIGEIAEEVNREELAKKIEEIANSFIDQSIETSIQFMPKSEMHTVCEHVPDYLPENKPARVVLYGKFGVPCGGTHVANLKNIEHLTIRKVGIKNGNIKVSYQVS